MKALKGRSKVAALSRLARESAAASAIKSNQDIENFEKDASGAPRPSKGVFWSVTHKPGVVAGVVSQEQIGIDLEQLKPVSDGLYNRIIDKKEALLFKGQDQQVIFFRGFTAKEAVLKKTTHGIKGLSKAKIDKVIDDKNLLVKYLDHKYWVENFYFDGYLASVTKDHFDVQWTIE